MSYESDVLRNWYVLFHYGTPDQILKGSAFSPQQVPPQCFAFPVATVDALQMDQTIERALDLGCAVGRSSFELSKTAGQVIGIDYSESFIETAQAIQTGDPYSFVRYGEAHLKEPLSVQLPGEVFPDRVNFEQGDAMDLRFDLGEFDLVHAANLLCRLPEPLRFLERLKALVKAGGRLVLATPTTWMTQYTPAENIPEGETLDFLRSNSNPIFPWKTSPRFRF